MFFYMGGVNRWISALMVLILILLSACKKESITHERFNTELTSSNNLNLKSLDSISVRVIDNVMHFADAHAADAALDYLNNLSDDDRRSVEKTYNFISMRTVYDSLFMILDTIAEETRFNDFLLANQHWLGLSADEVTVDYSYESHHSIASGQGVFVIGQTICRITPLGILAWHGGTIDQMLHLVVCNNFVPDTSAGMYYYLQLLYDNSSGCGASLNGSFTNSENNRRVTIKISTKIGSNPPTYCEPLNNMRIHRHYRVDILVKGFKKNIFGKWINYKNPLEFKDVSFELYVPYQYDYNHNQCRSIWHFITGGQNNQSKKGDVRELIDHWIGGEDPGMGSDLSNILPPHPYFLKVKGKAKSRGVGDNWAVINCGYVL